MAARTPLQNTIFAFIGQIGARLVALGFYAVVARSVGEAFYGDIGLGWAMGVVFFIAVEPGLNPLLIRDGARSREVLAARTAETLAYTLATTAVSWPVMIGIAWLMDYRGSTLWAVALSGGSLILVGLEDFSSAVLMASERMDLEATLRITSRVGFAAAGIAAILVHAPFVVLLTTMTVSQAMAGGLGLFLIHRAGVPVRVGNAWAGVQKLGEAWPLALTGSVWLVTLRVDQVIARQIGVSRDQMGDFSAAAKLVEALSVVVNALALTFSPLISRAWLESRAACTKTLEMTIGVSLVFTLPLAVGGALLATPISVLIFGADYQAAGLQLCIQLAALPLLSVQLAAFQVLVAAGRIRTQGLIMLTGLVFNVALLVAGMPRWGVLAVNGAAVSGALWSAIAAVICVGLIGIRPRPWKVATRPVLSAAAMGAVVLALRSRLSVLPCIAAGGAVYVATLTLLGGRALLDDLRGLRRGP
jgi:PST family polysaccharide transporter